MTLAENISWKKLQDKIVAVNITTGVYYTLNKVASTIWAMLMEDKSKEEIVEALSKEYPDIDAATLGADYDEQIAYWKSENLLK